MPSQIGPRSKMPAAVLIGIVLTCLGVGFTGVIFAWGFFALRGLTGPEGDTGFFQTQYALSAAKSLILNLGWSLLGVGILRILPRGGLWSWVGPVLIFAGGVAVAIAFVAQMLLVPFLFPTPLGSQTSGISVSFWESTSNAAFFAGSMAVTVGILLSLVAVARGILARRAVPGPPASA